MFDLLFKRLTTRGPFDSESGEFRHPDPQAISRHLKLEKLAERRGNAELPPSDATSLDDAELSVYRELSRLAQLGREQVGRQFEALEARQNAVIPTGVASRIEAAASDFAIKMIAQVRTGTIVLFNKKRAVADSEKSLDTFKKYHGISWPAHFPDPSGHWKMMAILAFVFALETLANAFLFAEASEFGLVGGFLEAMFISFINLALGFLVGLFILTHLVHSNWFHRAAFLLVVILCVVGLLSWNLFAGHYRDAVAAFAASGDTLSIPQLGGAALDNLVAQPYRLEDFKSWMFLILGVIAVIVALTEGYNWDEPFPGYGRRYRQNRELVNQYGALFNQLQGRLHLTVDEGRQLIESRVAQYRAQLSEAYSIQNRATSLAERFQGYLGLLERTGTELLAKYRNVNIEARSTPTPQYFSTPFKMNENDRAVPAFTARNISELELEPVIERAQRKITEHHSSLLQAYKTVDQLTAREVEQLNPIQFVETALSKLAIGNPGE